MEVIICGIKGYRDSIDVDAPVSTGSFKDYLMPVILRYWCRCTAAHQYRIVARWLLNTCLDRSITIYKTVEYIVVAEAL